MNPRYRQASYEEPMILERHDHVDHERTEYDEAWIPESMKRRESLNIPDLEEFEVVRHFTRLSQMNYGVDTGIYPLGSCTMKHNPKISEVIAGMDKAVNVHPCQDGSTLQGSLRMMYELQQILCRIGGMDACTLQPAAGAQGEFTGLLMARAYHRSRGEGEIRNEIVLPDSSHGTNPATASMAGYKVLEIQSKDGCVDLEALKAAVSEKTAALMLTNPNTLGIFEKDALEIARIVHDAGGLLYYDGANLNAIMGRTTPGDMNFDIVHFNLHKTFGTPHGGGGPGAGPVGVTAELERFLPVPMVALDGGRYYLDFDRPDTIGKVRGYYGNFLVLLKAYVYIRLLGAEGLARASDRAVLNANYLRARLSKLLPMPYQDLRKHEFVLSGSFLKERGLTAVNLAKRLLDYGFHAPTVYFPHLVDEAIMVEPTETETKETLDAFVDAVEAILQEDPELVRGAPYNTSAGRIDEVKAAKDMNLSYRLWKQTCPE